MDNETKWAALVLMLGTSGSVVALVKKMAKPETKTVTRTVAVPKTKIVKQEPQQQAEPKDTERQTSHLFVHSRRYLINKTTEINVKKPVKNAWFVAV